MFGYGRRRSHGQLARAELGQSLNHLKQAAAHAAGGVGARVGPQVRNARGYVSPAAARVRRKAASGWLSTTAAIGPLAAAGAGGAKQAGSMARTAKWRSKQVTGKRRETRSGRRWPLMLAAGAAVGAVAAKAMRRRQEREWEGYDPTLALETARSGEMPPTAAQAGQSGVAQASLAAEQQSAMGRSSSPMEKAKGTASAADERLGSAAESTKQTAGRTVDKTESAALGNTSRPSRNGRA